MILANVLAGGYDSSIVQLYIFVLKSLIHRPVKAQAGCPGSVMSCRVRMRAVILTLIATAWMAWGTPADLHTASSPHYEYPLTIGASPAPEEETAAAAKPPELFRRVSYVARGLNSPDGIALDPATGTLYVSEEDAANIIRIRPNGTREVLFEAGTPLYEDRNGHRIRMPGLRSPEGLALDRHGTLYVVEDIPGGRLVTFDTRNVPTRSRRSGTVIPLPPLRGRYAWESVAVGPAGELLLAGSTLESFGRGPEDELLFRGALLYRDTDGEWWMPVNHPMSSYSAVDFSPDGNLAYFACEVTGVVGCLDLRPRFVRVWYSQSKFRSPEGLHALPGGGVLVAEEGGTLQWWDPTTDRTQLLYAHQGTFESVVWDGRERRLLVTEDRNGDVLALELKPGLELRPAFGREQDMPFTQEVQHPGLVPDECPAYLAQILKLAGYLSPSSGGRLPFRDFARRYCLIAIDAETVPMMPTPESIEDPITRIQFVVVAPYLIGFLEGELIWSASGFTAVKQSGEIVKTELVKRQVIKGDLLERTVTPMGVHIIALPIPFSARMDNEGLVSVNFMGMGIMEDFFLVLDTGEPDESVMVVIQPGGNVHQYQVRLPPDRDRSHWVIALEHQGPVAWKRLTE